jgi:hypothetical protein
MNTFKSLSLAAVVAAISLVAAAPRAQAQIGVTLGVAPECPYGYYDYTPYDCAPYGYYGPEWFIDGAFIGAGPWFHGHDAFRGRVDHHFDAKRGYGGALPGRGDRPHPSNPLDRMERFSPTELHDGRGGGFGEMGGHEGGGHEGGGRR